MNAQAENTDIIADTTRTIAADNPRRKAYKVPAWPLYLVGAPAAVAVWAGWVGLGGDCGFGLVQPLPGIVSWHLDTAITLPVGVEAYGALALRAWLTLPRTIRTGGRGSAVETARRFARGSAISALGLGMLGQAAFHILSAAHVTRAPWPITALVACLPVVAIGLGAALIHLLRGAAAELADGVPGTDGPGRVPRPAGGPVVEVPAGTAVRVAPGPGTGPLPAYRATGPAAGPRPGPGAAGAGSWWAWNGNLSPEPAQTPPAGKGPTAPAGAARPSPGRSAPPAGLPGAGAYTLPPLPDRPGGATGSGDAARTGGPARNAEPGRATVPPPSGPPARPGTPGVPPARPAAADSGPVPGPVSALPQGLAAARAAYRVSVAAGDPKSARQLAADHGISRRQAGKITAEDREDVPRPLALVRDTGAETTGATR